MDKVRMVPLLLGSGRRVLWRMSSPGKLCQGGEFTPRRKYLSSSYKIDCRASFMELEELLLICDLMYLGTLLPLVEYQTANGMLNTKEKNTRTPHSHQVHTATLYTY